MIFILTSLTIYLILSATPGESGITYSTPKRERQTKEFSALIGVLNNAEIFEVLLFSIVKI